MKKIIWNSKAREFVKNLEHKTRIEIGTLLMILQSGDTLGFPQSRPIKSVHPKAFELRIKDRDGSYRVIYLLYFEEMILIPHVFAKQSQKTPIKEIEIAIKRTKELLNEIK